MIEFKYPFRKFSESKTIQDCIDQIKYLLKEEEINESNADKFYEAIKCLKNHEEDIRVLRQELEAQLRLYKNEIFLKELIEKGKISL